MNVTGVFPVAPEETTRVNPVPVDDVPTSSGAGEVPGELSPKPSEPASAAPELTEQQLGGLVPTESAPGRRAVAGPRPDRAALARVFGTDEPASTRDDLPDPEVPRDANAWWWENRPPHHDR